jgi:hypothetical protein
VVVPGILHICEPLWRTLNGILLIWVLVPSFQVLLEDFGQVPHLIGFSLPPEEKWPRGFVTSPFTSSSSVTFHLFMIGVLVCMLKTFSSWNVCRCAKGLAGLGEAREGAWVAESPGLLGFDCDLISSYFFGGQALCTCSCAKACLHPAELQG